MYPTRLRIWSSISRPRQRTSPRSGSSTPRMMRIAVVLPAPLGPDEPEQLPLGDGERQVVQRHQVAIAAGQALQFQHVVLLTPVLTRM